LFRLVHHLLSPSVDIRVVIGSHLNARDGFDNSKKQADNAAKQALESIRLVKPTAIVPVIAGSNTAMMNDSTPVKSEAVRFIIKEAMRTDVKSPLYVVCGAGLTEIASAVLMQPEIEKKIILIWIGGAEYPDLPFLHLIIPLLNIT
jgi:purine nucleosidase